MLVILLGMEIIRSYAWIISLTSIAIFGEAAYVEHNEKVVSTSIRKVKAWFL